MRVTTKNASQRRDTQTKNYLRAIGRKLGLAPRFDFLCENPKYSMYSIGRFSYGEPKVLRWGEKATLKIGSFCSIADSVTILLGGEHNPNMVTTYPFNQFFEEFKSIVGHPSTKGDVVIGNDVWIGENALVLSGVSIGDGAVIGACSVVTKDVEPYTIVGGNPVKVIRKRFDEETISKLLRIRWWDWDIKRIKENVPFLLSDNVKKFLEKNNSNVQINDE